MAFVDPDEDVKPKKSGFIDPDDMSKVGIAAVQGAVGGPLSALFNAFKESDRQAQEKIGGLAYEGGSNVAGILGDKVSPELASAAGVGTNMAIQGIPAALGFGWGKAAAPLTRRPGRFLMRQALKPPPHAQRTGDAGRAVETLLREDVSPTMGGVRRLEREIDTLNAQVQGAINSSPATVPTAPIARSMDIAIDNALDHVNRGERIAEVMDTWNKFIRDFGDRIPVAEANRVKSGTQRALRAEYGHLSTPVKEAEKGITHGLRAGIAGEVPEVVAPLAREADLINAYKLLEARAQAYGNSNLFGFGAMSPRTINAAVWMADRIPWLKGILARSLYRGAPQEALGGILGAYAGAQEAVPAGAPSVDFLDAIEKQRKSIF